MLVYAIRVTSRPLHLGIVAMSPEGCAPFYRALYRQLNHANDQPRITLHNEPLADYLRALNNQDWHAIAELLVRSARHLASCGVNLILCPENVIQHAIPLAQAASPIPWLPMPELVADAVATDRHHTVGLLGTDWVMAASTYQTHLGLKGTKVVVPDEQDAHLVNQIILGELVYGEACKDTQDHLLAVVDRLAAKGAQAVLLGSSELPNAVNPSNCRMPLYDPAQILAHAAIERAMHPSA